MTPSASSPKRAVVLYGALAPDAAADELDVLNEVATVSEALSALGWRPESVALSLDVEMARQALAAARPAFVFNLVESVAGRGRWAPLAPSLLEELSIPFTGTPYEGMIYSSGKLLAKRLLLADGIAAPPAWGTKGDGPPPSWPGRWIVKSCWEHASVGIDDGSVVSAEKVSAEVARRSEGGGAWFAEGFVEGRELNISLVAGPRGIEVLPPAEIHFEDYPPDKPRIVGYAAKWDPVSFEYRHARRSFDFPPADRELLEAAADVSRRTWSSLGLRGYARVDLRVDRGGTPWVIDVNANPCLTPGSGFVATAERAGLDYADLIARIVDCAIEERALDFAEPRLESRRRAAQRTPWDS